MRNQFPETPILGLTATATPMVIEDIKKILNIKGCYMLKDSFFRDNLRYTIERVDDLKKEELIDKIVSTIRRRFNGQSGLIYCLTIKEVEEVAEKLNAGGVKAMAYHAQLPPEQRNRAYYRWFNDQVQVIVGTVAFGMGINKNSVRFVLHYSMSKSFENYYQETGRAGRDGRLAECILYFKFADIFRVSAMSFTERNGLTNVYAMMAFCLNRRICRKEQIADYFGDTWAHVCINKCDNCAEDSAASLIETDVTEDMQDLCNILAFAVRNEKRLTYPKLIDLWLGKGEKKLRPENLVVCRHSRETAQAIVGHLLVDHFLKEEFHFTPYSTISYVAVGPSWLIGRGGQQPIRYWLPSSTGGKKLNNKNGKRVSKEEEEIQEVPVQVGTSKKHKRQLEEKSSSSSLPDDYELITLE